MKKLNEYAITVFGDSISKGVYIDDGKIKNLGTNAIDIIESKMHIKIENKSVYGQTLMRVYQKDMIGNYLLNIDKIKNNVVVISLGGNDADYKWDEVALSPLEKHTSKTDLIEFENMLNNIIESLKSNNVTVVLTSLPPINAERYFKIITKNKNKENILKFLNNDISNLTRNQEAFNLAILKIADKNKCHFIDFRTSMLQQIDYLDMLCEDGIHPNEQGQKYIAEFVLNFAQKNLTI